MLNKIRKFLFNLQLVDYVPPSKHELFLHLYEDMNKDSKTKVRKVKQNIYIQRRKIEWDWEGLIKAIIDIFDDFKYKSKELFNNIIEFIKILLLIVFFVPINIIFLLLYVVLPNIIVLVDTKTYRELGYLDYSDE